MFYLDNARVIVRRSDWRVIGGMVPATGKASPGGGLLTTWRLL